MNYQKNVYNIGRQYSKKRNWKDKIRKQICDTDKHLLDTWKQDIGEIRHEICMVNLKS